MMLPVRRAREALTPHAGEKSFDKSSRKIENPSDGYHRS